MGVKIYIFFRDVPQISYTSLKQEQEKEKKRGTREGRCAGSLSSRKTVLLTSPLATLIPR